MDQEGGGSRSDRLSFSLSRTQTGNLLDGRSFLKVNVRFQFRECPRRIPQVGGCREHRMRMARTDGGAMSGSACKGICLHGKRGARSTAMCQCRTYADVVQQKNKIK